MLNICLTFDAWDQDFINDKILVLGQTRRKELLNIFGEDVRKYI